MTQPEPTQPLPETDGWDKDAKAHPRVRWIHRLVIIFAVMAIFGPIGYGWYYIRNERMKVNTYGRWDKSFKIIELKGATNFDLYLIPRIHSNLDTIDRASLIECKNLTDLNHLEKLTGLKVLELGSCYILSDLTPLEKITGLQKLTIFHCPKITQAQVDRLQKKLPNCRIDYMP